MPAADDIRRWSNELATDPQSLAFADLAEALRRPHLLGARLPGQEDDVTSTPQVTLDKGHLRRLTAEVRTSTIHRQLKTLIKSGGGTGPVKPDNRPTATSARCQIWAGPPAR